MTGRLPVALDTKAALRSAARDLKQTFVHDLKSTLLSVVHDVETPLLPVASVVESPVLSVVPDIETTCPPEYVLLEQHARQEGWTAAVNSRGIERAPWVKPWAEQRGLTAPALRNRGCYLRAGYRRRRNSDGHVIEGAPVDWTPLSPWWLIWPSTSGGQQQREGRQRFTIPGSVAAAPNEGPLHRNVSGAFVVIVEGPTDATALDLAIEANGNALDFGYLNLVLAASGTSNITAVIEAVMEWTRQPILVICDHDKPNGQHQRKAGNKAANKALKLLGARADSWDHHRRFDFGSEDNELSVEGPRADSWDAVAIPKEEGIDLCALWLRHRHLREGALPAMFNDLWMQPTIEGQEQIGAWL